MYNFVVNYNYDLGVLVVLATIRLTALIVFTQKWMHENLNHRNLETFIKKM